MYLADLLRKVRLKFYLRKIKRHTLRVWLKLSDIQRTIQEAADAQDVDGVYHNLTAYVSAAIGNCPELPWADFYVLYGEIMHINQSDDIYPILRVNEDSKKLTWDYAGRSWYFWTHTLSKNFGWSMEYIGNLDINDAIALLQEIEVDEQLEREFRWDMSEMAYSYDGSSSKHHPLTRPSWMVEHPLTKHKDREKPALDPRFMPIGNVAQVDAQH